MKTTTDLILEIETRFRQGDAARDLLPELAVRIAEIERRMGETGYTLSPELREEMTKLLEIVETAVESGGDWLIRARADSLELASEHLSQRVRRTYRLPGQHERRTAT